LVAVSWHISCGPPALTNMDSDPLVRTLILDAGRRNARARRRWRAQIESLRRGLRLYLSVLVDDSYKSQTTMRPVGRVPLITQNENVKPVAAPWSLRLRVGGGGNFALAQQQVRPHPTRV
jgi:hypothetical protein